MGDRPHASIAYGVVVGTFDEEWESPWDNGDEEEWWRKTCGYEPEELDWEDDMPDELVRMYFQRQREFDAQHPMPFKLLYVGSWDSEERVLCVPDTHQETCWVATDLDVRTSLNGHTGFIEFVDFLKSVGIEQQPRWLLFPFWG